MILITPAPVTGDGGVHALSSYPGMPTKCKWWQVTGDTIVADPGFVGDKNIGTSGGGQPITAAGGQFSPPIALAMEFYDLTNIYLLLQSGDTASIVCAV